MSTKKGNEWDALWDVLIDKVILRTGLVNVCDSPRDARQFLSVQIIDFGVDRFRNASQPLQYTVLYRRAVDAIRRHHAHRERSNFSYFDDDRLEEWVNLARDPEWSPEDVVAFRELVDQLDTISARVLSSRECQVLKQYLKGHKSQEEIARECQVSRTRIQQILESSISRVVAVLSQHPGAPGSDEPDFMPKSCRQRKRIAPKASPGELCLERLSTSEANDRPLLGVLRDPFNDEIPSE